jgi:histidyl-tRNA synthetase
MEISVPDLAAVSAGRALRRADRDVFRREYPACGFSLGLERILVVMGERQMFPPDVQSSGPDVLVTIFGAESAPPIAATGGRMRAAGFRVEVYPEPDKLGKQFKYASARNAAVVAILGER